MRHIPIFTFINKMDRDANDTFELLDDIEKELGIATCPINWPIDVYKRQLTMYKETTGLDETSFVSGRCLLYPSKRRE